MIEKFLDAFRDDLRRRGCDLAVVALVRHPVAHRVSQFLKFRDGVDFDPGLVAIATPRRDSRSPTTPFRSNSFASFYSWTRRATETISRRFARKFPTPRARAGEAAADAVEAAALIARAAATAQLRRELGKPHATFEGVLHHAVDGLSDAESLVGGGDLPARFEAALDAGLRDAKSHQQV